MTEAINVIGRLADQARKEQNMRELQMAAQVAHEMAKNGLNGTTLRTMSKALANNGIHKASARIYAESVLSALKGHEGFMQVAKKGADQAYGFFRDNHILTLKELRRFAADPERFSASPVVPRRRKKQEVPQWESLADGPSRFPVENGYIYSSDNGICFAPKK